MGWVKWVGVGGFALVSSLTVIRVRETGMSVFSLFTHVAHGSIFCKGKSSILSPFARLLIMLDDEAL